MAMSRPSSSGHGHTAPDCRFTSLGIDKSLKLALFGFVFPGPERVVHFHNPL